jgi:hypothetical protein
MTHRFGPSMRITIYQGLEEFLLLLLLLVHLKQDIRHDSSQIQSFHKSNLSSLFRERSCIM